MVLPAVLAGAAAAQIAGDVYGRYSSAADRRRAERQQMEAARLIAGVEGPSLEQLQYDPDLSGFVPPDVEQAKALQSAYSILAADPTLALQQREALSALGQIADSGGMTAVERANADKALQDAQGLASQQAAAGRESMQARGLAGGGAELALQALAGQRASNRAADYNQNIQAMAQDRALSAIRQRGALAGDIRGQEMGEAERRAAALDAINRYNEANRLSQANLSAGYQQQSGVGRSNAINDAARYNTGAAQRDYENRVDRAARQAGIHNTSAQQSANRAADDQRMWSGIGRAGSQALSAYGTYGTYGGSQAIPAVGDRDYSDNEDTEGGYVYGRNTYR